MNFSARPLTGILFAICAVACFATADLFTRQLASLVPIAMAMWVRYLIQVGMTVALAPRLVRIPVADRTLLLQIVRGLLQLGSGILGFVSLRYMQVGEFVAILMLTPIVMTVAVACLFGERLSWPRWTLLTAAMCGALLVVWPGDASPGWYLVFPFTVVLTSAAFHLVTSRLAGRHNSVDTHLYTGVVCLVLTSVLLPFSWQSFGSWQVWGELVMQGVACAIGHYLLIVAFRHAPVSLLTPYLYLHIVFGTLGAWIVYAHVPNWLAGIGITVVFLCGVGSAWVAAAERRKPVANEALIL